MVDLPIKQHQAKMPVVDVHTHVYPPAYMSLLRSRRELPYVRSFPDNPSAGDRLVILPAEDTESTSRGRPIGSEYYDVAKKIAFMDAHGIDISVMSLANPWLDWLPAESAAATAREINDDVERMCAEHEGRLYAFGTLPLSAPAEQVVDEIARLGTLKHMRGVIIGTSGLGSGLDDPELDPIYTALEKHNHLIFLHPHYGLPTSVYGPRASDYGHVLPLALGFPLETTIAVTRMLLSGVWDRFQNLNVLIAHSGGTLPFLGGRIESCIAHDAHLKAEGKLDSRRSVWDVLKKNIYLDAVIYADIGLKAAIEASGADRLLFGTDHPFFPPLDEGEKEWLSVKMNSQAVKSVFADDSKSAAAIMGGNAARILRLDS
jgi:aminocarboxymuconate-semialdehyde decarboxylase